MLNQFFITNAPAFPLLWEQHHPGLVALSVAMAVLASVLALQMAALARRADAALTRQLARGSGALAPNREVPDSAYSGIQRRVRDEIRRVFEVYAAGRRDERHVG